MFAEIATSIDGDDGFELNVPIVLIAVPPTLAPTASEYAPLTFDVTVSVPSLNESSSEPTSTQSLVAPAASSILSGAMREYTLPSAEGTQYGMQIRCCEGYAEWYAS